MSSFQERKTDRATLYFAYVYGWRTEKCIACDGTGRYDHNGSPKCGACDGTGKTQYPGPKAKKPRPY